MKLIEVLSQRKYLIFHRKPFSTLKLYTAMVHSLSLCFSILSSFIFFFFHIIFCLRLASLRSVFLSLWALAGGAVTFLSIFIFLQLRHKHIDSMKMNCSSSGNVIKLIDITMRTTYKFLVQIISVHCKMLVCVLACRCTVFVFHCVWELIFSVCELKKRTLDEYSIEQMCLEWFQRPKDG